MFILSRLRGFVMKLLRVLSVCLASASFLSPGAHAAAFLVEDFPDPFNVAPAAFTETFESYSAGQWNEANVTNVGTFGALAPPGTGSGSTCTTLGGDCTQLFLSDIEVNGQGNITPQFGTKALQANDTFGMVWHVSTRDDRAFNDIFFGIRDAADQGAKVTITLEEINGSALASPVVQMLSGLPNGKELLISLALAGLSTDPVTSAKISLRSSKVNDSFTLDGAALTAVPVPAALPLFLSALVGFGFVARRRRTT